MAAKRRSRRRRRKSGGFILSFLTFCIVIAAIVMSVTVFLKVADIYVSGTTRYEHEKIIEASGIKTGDNMFLLNKFEVAERILDEFPYIEQIKIRRKLPDTFTFEITEREPSAYVMAEGNRWLIDKKGYLLEMLGDDAETKLPKISGIEVMTPRAGGQLVLKNEDQMSPLCEVLTSLDFAGMTADIARIELDKLYDIKLIYGDRFLVSLGDTGELSKKIEMLRAVISELAEFDRGTINVSAVKEARFKPDTKIDLSEKSAPAVQPQSEDEVIQSEVESGGAEKEKEEVPAEETEE